MVADEFVILLLLKGGVVGGSNLVLLHRGVGVWLEKN